MNNKPYKNCRLGNRIFKEGRKGAIMTLDYLRRKQYNRKRDKLKKLIYNPCQTKSAYDQARFMGKTRCLSHNKIVDQSTSQPVTGTNCNGQITTGEI